MSVKRPRCKPLRETLRQTLGLLEGERQALAALDLERIITCADGKLELCGTIEQHSVAHPGGTELDEECRGLLDAVQRMNAVNRRMRNLIAANVEGRLSTLSGASATYRGSRANAALQRA